MRTLSSALADVVCKHTYVEKTNQRFMLSLFHPDSRVSDLTTITRTDFRGEADETRRELADLRETASAARARPARSARRAE
jgi:hypothetical protein